jgi:precorrin-3B synthase
MTQVRGWCPGAHRPMMSGDGLVVRVRPRAARLTLAQATGLARAAMAHGAGLLDLTNRANLQIRGVSEGAWPALLAELAALDLLDADPTLEGRRNILVAPNWVEGDDTSRLNGELAARLGELPDLPAKVGFAIDAGPRPVLTSVSADFRIERGGNRGLILRADGRALGAPLAPGTDVSRLIAMAEWFAATGARRMRDCADPLPRDLTGTAAHAPVRAPIMPGTHMLGMMAGLPFGQIAARDLLAALEAARPVALRLTPWRALILEGVAPQPLPGMVMDADAPELSAHACPGAPYCVQSSVETRALARTLALKVPGLHVSGCAKGCAHPGPAAVVLTGHAGAFDLALGARAGDPPLHRGLSAAQALAHFGA